MGNAPLSSPPTPTEHRIVVPITTNRKWFGTRLEVLPRLGYTPPSQSASGRTASIRPAQETATTVVDADVAARGNQDTTSPSSSTQLDALAPPPLFQDNHSITAQDYKDKMELLQDRLSHWRGGYAMVILLIFVLFMVFGFLAAYFVPDFWRSPLFYHPAYMVAAGVAVIGILSGLLWFMKRESQGLQAHVADLYRDWRGRGVHVTLKRVAHVGGVYRVTPHGIRRQAGTDRSGNHNFCLVMTVVEDGDDGTDAFSVGTVNTDDSRMSGDDDDDNDDDEEVGSASPSGEGVVQEDENWDVTSGEGVQGRGLSCDLSASKQARNE